MCRVLAWDVTVRLGVTRWVSPADLWMYNRLEVQGPDSDGPHSRIKWS